MIRWFAGHPTAANLLMIALLAVGLTAAPGLRRQTFPDFTADEVEIRVVYPGASAEDVELAICQRIEDAIEGVGYLSELRCEAREGLAIAVAEMDGDGEIDQFLTDIETDIDAIDSFPDTVEDPVIDRLNRTDRVVSIAITGPMPDADLKMFAEEVRDRLVRLPDVSQVTLDGFSDRQIRITPRAAVLREYGLSVADIADAVARQSVDLPGGTLETRARDILIRFADARRRPLDFESLVVVAGSRGGEVRLGEIATITDRFELDEARVLFNGRRAALLKVTKTRTEDTLDVMDAVEAFLVTERAAAPPGVAFALTENVSSIVRDRLQMLIGNGVAGLALVFGVMWLFFTFRFSFWVAMGLPVSFLGTLFVMTMLGLSINMITMVGLLIAIGLLMDDAIVISESIAARLREGLAPLEAAVAGVGRVGPGVLASFATTVCVFAPLMFLEGNIGRVLKEMPVVLIAVLVVSFVEAFLILPNHLVHAERHRSGRPPSRFRRGFDAGFEWVRTRVVGGLVKSAVSWRYLTTGLGLGVLLVSVAMIAGGVLKTRAFPALDGDVLQARLLLPQGTPLARTEAIVDQIVAALARTNDAFRPRQPEGRDLVVGTMVRTGVNVDAYESGPHLATVSADLLTAELRDATIDEIAEHWRAEVGPVADAIALTFKEPQIGPAGLPIDVRLEGRDLDELKAAALALQDYLAGFRGVVDLEDDLRPGKPELRLTLREGAADLGVDAAMVANQVRAAFYGTTADEVEVGGESYEIDVRLAPGDQDGLADIAYFTVKAPASRGGAEIPLSMVAEITQARGYARINRIDGVRTVTVRGDIQGDANANEIMALTQAEFFARTMARDFPGVSVNLAGEQEEQARTRGSMITGFLLGLLGVFLLLSLQFRSYLEPIVVMMAIPMALIGVVWGHLGMGLDVSMPSIMGFVSLSGIVVNNAILLVEFTKHGVAEGLALPDALTQASRQRFRALAMTTLTTFAGLLPILLEKSLQAQILIPLVTSLAFGLLASAILVLFVVPSLYGVLDDLGLARPRA